MFDVGFSELILLGIVALVVLGPEKLPHAARMAGAWLGRIRRTVIDIQAEIEKEVLRLAGKARDNKLGIDEMTGGTFTITNGGVFGSMLSTPIINAPQSAILGMHNIVERPVAVNGHVLIRAVMYVALSYDHRIIDGRESVGFLVRVKQLLEDPARLLLGV